MAKVILFVYFIFTCMAAMAQTNKTVSIEAKEVSLKEITKKIESQTDYSFTYNESIDLSQKKTISIKNKTIDEALKIIFNRSGIIWKLSGKHIVLSKQKKEYVIVSGFITDAESDETLIGATVSDKLSGMGGFSNSYGYYSVRIPLGELKLEASYIGYKGVTKKIVLENDTTINFKLAQGEYLKEVVITDSKKFTPSGSSIELSSSNIKAMPAMLGETDVLKSLQYIPGVQSGINGTSGMYVRGGGADQNLYLLDGVPLYNIGHAFGLFSIFNADAVKKVTLHKGSFPARYGGRLSSVVDIRLKDGDMYNYRGDISIGLISSRLNIEGPIFKGKTSFNFSARRSYIDAFLRSAKLFTDDPIPIFYLYDVNLKLNHKFSDKSRLYLSMYKGLDKIGYKTEDKNTFDDFEETEKTNFDLNWGNTIVSTRWNYIFSNKLFANTTLAYNKYEFKYNASIEDTYKANQTFYSIFQNSGVKDWSFSTDLEYIPNDKHHFRFGGGLIFHKFKPEIHGNKIKESHEENEIVNKTNYFLNDNIHAKEASLYAEDEFVIYDKLKANLGLHFALFNVQGKTYNSLQPRISMGYEFNQKLSLKGSYSGMNQHINLLTSNLLSQPSDLWVPITKQLKPMQANQFTLGAYYNLANGYNFSVEGFYKSMNNLLEYKDGAALKDPYSTWEKEIEVGKGWVYGLEFFAQKSIGKVTGWLGYTLAWNNRQFKTINNGNRFPAKYDRRHDVKMALSYRPSKKIEIGASWMYATGNNTTLATEEYAQLNSFESMNAFNHSLGGAIPYVAARNNYRLPATHHLDLDLKYHRSERKMWTLSIYNVYNQFNPYIVYPRPIYIHNSHKYRNVITQYSLLRIVPSITFTYKFK